MTTNPADETKRVRELYLSTMIRILTNTIYEDSNVKPSRAGAFNAQQREGGTDWPEKAFTMIGVKRMSNLRDLAVSAIEAGVPGDFIETGIWRGGACIMMRAVLEAYGERGRKVFCADSFEGVPPANAADYPRDTGKKWDKAYMPELAIPRSAVEDAFRKFDLLDEQVEFLQGWFKDTLPTVKDRSFAVIRLDGDLYESTIQALDNLYPGLSPGGYAIIDDYALGPCKAAVTDYRQKHGINDEIHVIDITGVWWQKSS
jgi:O-methyltransferase